ncbi:STAS domain-containing protein [bacterium]|nr:STAS domain-containing protein [bacterium]
MSININKKDNVIILNILDDVILDTVDEFRDVILSLIKKNTLKVILNLSDVEFISSRGLGAIGYSADLLRKKGGDLKVFGIKPDVKNLFEICGLIKIIDIFHTEEEALLSCGDNVGNIEKRLLWAINSNEALD